MLPYRKKSLKIRATNLSLGVEIEIPAIIEKEGIIAISGSILTGVFSNIFQTLHPIEKQPTTDTNFLGNLLGGVFSSCC